MTTIRKILVEIQESQEFEKLEPFKQASVWTSFAQTERLLLARLLVLQGEKQLAQGDDGVLESFEKANQITDDHIEILYQQSTILSLYRDNLSCLTLALQFLSRALQKDEQSIKIFLLRAQVLTDIGLFENDVSYLIDACEDYQKAFHLIEKEDTSQITAIYWKWGNCLAELGKISGEPIDVYRSIEKYQLLYQLGYREADFLNDFGQRFVELANLLGKVDYLLEGLNLFDQAVQYCPSSFDGWYNQGCCIQALIEFNGYDHLLEQADQCFFKAAEIQTLHHQLWLKWGQLETTIGKIKRQPQKIESSLNKFIKANQLDPNHPEILKNWAEAELFLGAQEERLDLIQAARLKILTSLELQPDNSDAWCLYGSCLNELGRYFNEEDYYHQAIEKFQYGLSLNRQNPLLWYGMALSHYALGELTEDQLLFEKAVRYCSLVIEHEGEGFCQFWNDWGIALLKLAEFTQESSYVKLAIEKFEKALKEPIQNIEIEEIDLEWLCNYGTAYDLLGDLTEESCHFEKAIYILNQVIQIDPTYQQAHYHLALALSHLGETMFDVELYQKAIDIFQQLSDQNPEDDVIHLEFGMSLVNLALLIHDIYHPERAQQLYRQAETQFMQAASLGNAQTYYQLAGLYSITKHYDYAMHYLEKSLFVGVLPAIEDILHDEWLEGVRQIPTFKQFISELSTQQSMDDK